MKDMIYYKTSNGLVPRMENNSVYISKKMKTPAQLAEAVGKAICMLTSEGYQCEVHDEDCCGILITYNYYNDPNGREDFGNDRLMWVTCQEEEAITSERYRLANADDLDSYDEREDD